MRKLALVVFLSAFASSVPAASAPAVTLADSQKPPRFSFLVPTRLPPATPGEKYAPQGFPNGYPFCRDPPPRGWCGASGHRPRNPRGGIPPFTFSTKPLDPKDKASICGGRDVICTFRPPPDLNLNFRSGLLSGTLIRQARPGTHVFQVCVTESPSKLATYRPRTLCGITRLPVVKERAETWTAQLTGELRWYGGEGVYTETAKITLLVPPPGLATRLEKSVATRIKDIKGTFTGTETVAQQGINYTLTSSTTGPVPIEAEVVDALARGKFVVVTSTSILVPGKLTSSRGQDASSSARTINLAVRTIAATKITGTWSARDPDSRSGSFAQGTFELTKTSR